MYIHTELTDMYGKAFTKMFAIFNNEGQRVHIFQISRNKLTLENIKTTAMSLVAYKQSNVKFEFQNLDEYSPELVMIYRNNNQVKKYLITSTHIQ